MEVAGDVEEYNVQALSESCTGSVPSSFIRSSHERNTITPHDDFNDAIPMIDLAGLDDDRREATMAAIAGACEEWGFFQVVNHGIPLSLVQEAYRVSRQFFDLPLEEKKKLTMDPNMLVPQGYGRHSRQSENTTLDWHDLLFHYFLPLSHKNMDWWPCKPEAYREVMDKYGGEILKLTYRILEALSLLLGLQRTYLKEVFGDPMLNIRLNFYPPCPQPDLVLGLRPHSDPMVLTVLYQDEIGGLQVKKDHKWVGVTPVPNALVVNLGDQVQIVSNNKFHSVEHRAVTNQGATRLSMATFLSPNADAIIGPAPELVDETHPALFKTTNYAEYRASFHKKI